MANDSSLNERQVALFELGGETYGLDIGAVQEIIQMQPITRVPKAPFFVEGVINLRGRVIPVIDMGKRFGLDKVERTKNNRIVVVDVNGTTIGIIVDSVTEVMRIANNAVEKVSSVINAGGTDYIEGIAKLNNRMVILLELEKILSKDNLFNEITVSRKIEDQASELALAGNNGHSK